MECIPLEPRPPSEANQSVGQSRENINTTLRTDSTGEGALLVQGGESGEQQEKAAANGSDEEGRGRDEIEPDVQFRPEDPLVPEANGAEAEDESAEERGEAMRFSAAPLKWDFLWCPWFSLLLLYVK